MVDKVQLTSVENGKVFLHPVSSNNWTPLSHTSLNSLFRTACNCFSMWSLYKGFRWRVKVKLRFACHRPSVWYTRWSEHFDYRLHGCDIWNS